MSRQIAILGLGYFGVTVAKELRRQHDEVLGVDRREERINALADLFSHALVADITEEQALAELSLKDYDAVVIDTGDNLEASITATLLAREQGAREIWAKAHSDTHYRLLEHLGADHVVYPEYDTGMRVAESLHYHAAMNILNLGDSQFIVELQTTSRLREHYATIADLELDPDKLSLLAIKRGHGVIKSPGPDTALQEQDNLVLMGGLDELRWLGKHL